MIQKVKQKVKQKSTVFLRYNFFISFILSLFVLISSNTYATTIDDLKEMKPMEGRMGNSSTVEPYFRQNAFLDQNDSKYTRSTKIIKSVNQTDIVENKKNKPEISENKQDFNQSYADLSLKKLAKDVYSELNDDEMTINSDLSILWAAALERSETMKYTIYKLSNPDEDKPNDSAIKKILKPIANITSLAGASVAGDPYAAAGALIGGGLVNAFMKDDKEFNYQFSKVSDADMVLLVRKIDDLQKKLLSLYMDYKTKQEIMNMQNENFKKREQIYNEAKNKPKDVLAIADSYYRNAKKDFQKASDEFLTSKAILENLVGVEALSKIN